MWLPIAINTAVLIFAMGGGWSFYGSRVSANEANGRELKARMERLEEQRVNIEKILSGMEVSLKNIQVQMDTTLRTIQRQLQRQHEPQ
jgi:hypothetical protein